MWERGLPQEVAALALRMSHPPLPPPRGGVLQAIGVKELLLGLSEPEARARLVGATRRLAKQQRTWLRGRMRTFLRAGGGDHVSLDTAPLEQGGWTPFVVLPALHVVRAWLAGPFPPPSPPQRRRRR